MMLSTLLVFMAFVSTSPSYKKIESNQKNAPIIYSAPPPSPPPVYIWINGYFHRWNNEPEEDYDGDGA